jgi:uncharacterized protein DUF3857
MRKTSFAALILLLCPLLAGAAVPDWVKSAAQQPSKKYADDVNVVTLLDEDEYTVKESGEIVHHSRTVLRILRPEGKDAAYFGVPFNGDSKVSYLKAWGLMPGGQEFESKDQDVLESSASMGFEIYSDLKVKYLKASGGEVGSVLAFEYEQKERPYTFQLMWQLQGLHPVEHARFTLRLPPHWEYRNSWINHTEVPVATEGGVFAWDLKEIAGVEHEEGMPNWRAITAAMVVTLFGEKTKGRTYANWNDFGQWYTQLSAGMREPTPGLQLKVRELAPPSLGILERIKALAGFAQKDIRYAAIEIGIGGYRPHSAGEIFANRYGDCKDKATVLSSMLNEIGVHSYYVLIHTERGIFTQNSPPSIGFNHAILAIQLPEASQSRPMSAIFQHPRLGRLLIFDPTNDLVPFGEIPYYEQDNFALLVTGDGGELIHLPLSSPELNRMTRTAKLSVLPGGTVKADVEEVRTGTEAYIGRSQFRNRNEADRKKVVERQLRRVLGAFEVEKVETRNLDSIDSDFIVHYTFTAENYAKDAGSLLLVRPRLLGEDGHDLNSKKARHYAFEFPGPTLRTDIFEFNLPEGYKIDELPEAGKASFPFGTYTSKSENSGNVLRYNREYKIDGTMVPAGQFGELKKFFDDITVDERRMAVVKKGN